MGDLSGLIGGQNMGQGEMPAQLPGMGPLPPQMPQMPTNMGPSMPDIMQMEQLQNTYNSMSDRLSDLNNILAGAKKPDSPRIQRVQERANNLASRQSDLGRRMTDAGVPPTFGNPRPSPPMPFPKFTPDQLPNQMENGGPPSNVFDLLDILRKNIVKNDPLPIDDPDPPPPGGYVDPNDKWGPDNPKYGGDGPIGHR